MEHRVIAHAAGWVIDSDWQVHHKNGIRDDNRIENLVVISDAEHTRLHAVERWAPRCPNGHDYTEENTGRRVEGWRYCKQCNRDRARANREKSTARLAA
jgi:hypothetical protein